MQGLLGTYSDFRGKLNVVTLITALVLASVVVNNHNQCKPGVGYTEGGFVTFSYRFAIAIIVIIGLLFGIDIFIWIQNSR